MFRVARPPDLRKDGCIIARRRRWQTHARTPVACPCSRTISQGKGNKLMDQTFETFMAELREEKGPEEDTVTGLCQKDRPPVGVSQPEKDQNVGVDSGS